LILNLVSSRTMPLENTLEKTAEKNDEAGKLVLWPAFTSLFTL